MDLSEGKFAVNLARNTIESYVKTYKIPDIPKKYPKEFSKPSGVFTTIHTYPEKDLRGCIGYPYPEMPLIRALIYSAVEATRDPRFPPLTKDELDKIIIEVSILTKPKLIGIKKPEDYLKLIKIGEDGLIIKFGFQAGLLLPQVPVEYNWDVKTFLENLCYKAGLPKDAWKYEEAKIYKFQAEIFGEEKPYGRIKRF